MTYRDLNVIISDDGLMDFLNVLHGYHAVLNCSSDVDINRDSVRRDFLELSSLFMKSFRDKKRSL